MKQQVNQYGRLADLQHAVTYTYFLLFNVQSGSGFNTEIDRLIQS